MPKLYRPGGPKRGEPCDVHLTRTGLQVVGEDGVQLSLSYEQLDGRVAGYEDSYVVLSAATEGGLLEVWVERAFMAELKSHQPSFSPDFRRRYQALLSSQRKGNALRIFSPIAGLALLSFTIWFVMSGSLAGLLVQGIPISVEEAIGEAGIEDLAPNQTPCEDPALIDATEQILDSLVHAKPDSGYAFSITLIHSDVVNAYAMPGGKLFVFSGLLEATADPSEVAAVLGHEMQHVLGRHSLNRIVHRAGVGVAVGMMLGDATEFIALLGGIAGDLGVMEFGRDHEREADAVGLDLLAAAGFDPQAPTTFWGRIADEQPAEHQKLEAALSLVSTHPASAERTARLADLATDLPTPSPVALAHLDWEALKGRCSAKDDTEPDPQRGAAAAPE